MSIEEENKLIAGFMGGFKSKIDGKGNWIRFPERHAGTDSFAFWPKHLKYHSSWDWLMPVVEKIEERLAYAIWIEGQSCRIQLTEQHQDEGGKEIYCDAETKIQATWQAVTQFIQQYNKQQTK